MEEQGATGLQEKRTQNRGKTQKPKQPPTETGRKTKEARTGPKGPLDKARLYTSWPKVRRGAALRCASPHQRSGVPPPGNRSSSSAMLGVTEALLKDPSWEWSDSPERKT